MRYEYENIGNDIENLEDGIYWAFSTYNAPNRGLITQDDMTNFAAGCSESNASGELIHITNWWKVRIMSDGSKKKVRAIK